MENNRKEDYRGQAVRKLRGIVCFFILLALILHPLPAKSDTVRLKNGEILKGVVVEKTDTYIKLIQDGISYPLPYFFDEISGIDPEKEQAQNGGENTEKYECDYRVYKNDMFGFRVLIPSSWQRIEQKALNSVSQLKVRAGREIIFIPSGDKPIPWILIQVIGRHSDKDLLQFVRDRLRTHALSVKRNKGEEFHLREYPVEFLSGTGKSCVKAVFTMIPGENNRYVLSDREFTIADYYFPAGEYVIRIFMVAYSDEFFRYSGVAAKIAETFSFNGDNG
ncbi:MAG: hypothetical protein PHC33_02055 [Candidatus Omnitrophica bacterium]|nr:hypothetical protein [Candidatus Omnitrophota bacterium]